MNENKLAILVSIAILSKLLSVLLLQQARLGGVDDVDMAIKIYDCVSNSFTTHCCIIH